MARRSLRPELNRIRAWVRQGRTDAWIAHQLEVTVQQIQAFKREQQLDAGDDADGAAAVAEYDEDIDLRAEDDALIAAELDAAGRRVRWRQRSTTARRGMACGLTQPCRTIPSTPSIGPGTVRWRSPSRRIRS